MEKSIEYLKHCYDLVCHVHFKYFREEWSVIREFDKLQLQRTQLTEAQETFTRQLKNACSKLFKKLGKLFQHKHNIKAINKQFNAFIQQI